MFAQFLQESTIGYLQKSTWCNNYILAASIVILLCHGILRSLKEVHWKMVSEKSPADSPGAARDSCLQSTSTSMKRLDLFSRLALVVDQAIELPFIVAYHPAAIHLNIRDVPSPHAVQILLQVVILVLAEKICRPSIDRFLSRVLNADTDKDDGGAAKDLAAEYTIPKATLLLATAITNVQLARVAIYSGNLHLAAVIIWAALRQLGN
ncbi:MAG: hypothetical protein Q9167_002381 [Letrouitia subvulpina]